MTLFEAEPEVIPGLPGVSVLTEILMRLLGQSRENGAQTSHTLGNGLRLRVGTAEGEFIALSRPDDRPSEAEIDTVAQATGWLAWGTTWDHINKVWYAVLRPEDPPPPDEAPARAKSAAEPGKEPPEDAEFPDDLIRAALTDRAAPWCGTFTPWMLDSRAEAVKGMKRAELLEEISWLRRKFGPHLQGWKRARIAAALG